jgi:hypothetical protein
MAITIFFQIFHRVNSITLMEFFFQLAIFQVKSIIPMTIFFSIAFNRFIFQVDPFICFYGSQVDPFNYMDSKLILLFNIFQVDSIIFV